MKNKEQIYDEEIRPLMDKVIEVCEREGIVMLADFSIPTEEQPGLHVSTMILDKDRRAPLAMLQAALILGLDK